MPLVLIRLSAHWFWLDGDDELNSLRSSICELSVSAMNRPPRMGNEAVFSFIHADLFVLLLPLEDGDLLFISNN